MNNEKKQLTVKKDETFSLSNPSDLINFASTLKDYIKDQKLYSNIQGKAYVNVEGWQFAGAFLGLIPIVEDVINEGSESEYKYRATVKIINSKTGQVSGAGIAICSNKEKSKRGYDEYAIASTAQTRAIGKAYRNLLAWIIKAAGYEPTPAEEMPDDVEVKADTKPSNSPTAKETPDPPPPQPAELAKKKNELIVLLDSPYISEEQKDKMIDGLPKMKTVDRVEKAIDKIKETIDKLEENEIQRLENQIADFKSHGMYDDEVGLYISDKLKKGRTVENLKGIIQLVGAELKTRQESFDKQQRREVQHG